MFIGEVCYKPRYMAKTETFFLRGLVTIPNAGTYTSQEIDLGSFVNVGIKSSTLLRIHDIQVQVSNTSGYVPRLPANTAGAMAYQLTTQAQTAMVTLDDKNVVASGIHSMRNPDSAQNSPTQSLISDQLPQDFTEGYLVAVDSLFLAGQCDSDFADDVQVAICMEVSLEKATQANASVLALSQQ
tara:strand:+ start:606 stop:1157 length:552 start_codon:yes stop_codon:yes gene_type:complete